MRATLSILMASVICFGIVSAAGPIRGGHGHGHQHGHAKHGGLPPGLAKKFGPSIPERCYVAVDPRYDDRAWFLIDGRWVLREGFEPEVRVEVRHVMELPALPSPPPVPLPKLQVGLHVVLFGG
jgi:hypothetical protein